MCFTEVDVQLLHRLSVSLTGIELGKMTLHCIRLQQIQIFSFFFVLDVVVSLAQPLDTVETRTGEIAPGARLSFQSFVVSSVGAVAVCVYIARSVEMSYNI